jgi:hypothetical protein
MMHHELCTYAYHLEDIRLTSTWHRASPYMSEHERRLNLLGEPYQIGVAPGLKGSVRNPIRNKLRLGELSLLGVERGGVKNSNLLGGCS